MTSPRPPAPPTRTNSFFVVGTVLGVVALLTLAVLNGTVQRADPAYMAGEVVGVLVAALVLWLIVVGIARVMGKARTSAGRVQIAFWTTAVLVLGQAAALATRGVGRNVRLTAVTDSERTGLVVDSTGIRHSGFGFSLPSPGLAFQPDSTAQHAMDSLLAHQAALVAWVLRSPTSGATVIVEVTKGTREDEGAFRAFARGVQRTAGKAKGMEVLLDSTTWVGSTREYRYAARSPAGVYLQIRCIPHTTGGVGLIVCVTTGSGDPHDLDFVREGLAFAGP